MSFWNVKCMGSGHEGLCMPCRSLHSVDHGPLLKVCILEGALFLFPTENGNTVLVKTDELLEQLQHLCSVVIFQHGRFQVPRDPGFSTL